MVELLCSPHPQRGYERRHLYSLEVSVYGEFNSVTECLSFVTFVYLFIIARPHRPVKPFLLNTFSVHTIKENEKTYSSLFVILRNPS
jgi:hypothetical protein